MAEKSADRSAALPIFWQSDERGGNANRVMRVPLSPAKCGCLGPVRWMLKDKHLRLPRSGSFQLKAIEI